jgi:hypothetical protein
MLGDPVYLKRLVEHHGWKFSCINGDPVLGDGVKCYATMFYSVRKDEEWVLAELNGIALNLIDDGAIVIRRKIERVVYDDKIDKVGACDGACEECHLDDFKIYFRQPLENPLTTSHIKPQGEGDKGDGDKDERSRLVYINLYYYFNNIKYVKYDV